MAQYLSYWAKRLFPQKQSFRWGMNRWTCIPFRSKIGTYILHTGKGVIEMKLVIKYHPKLDAKQSAIIEELSFHTTKIYNIANYENREKEFRTT
jgi:hypothetical protein